MAISRFIHVCVQYAIGFLLLISLFSVAHATEFEQTFEDWKVIKDEHNKCYATSLPYKTRSFYGIRNETYIAIGYIEDDLFSISYTPGFPIYEHKGVSIRIDNQTYFLTKGTWGFYWTSSSVQDKKILDNFIGNRKSYFKVRSYKDNDLSALDYYSLTGVTDALKYMVNNCK